MKDTLLAIVKVSLYTITVVGILLTLIGCSETKDYSSQMVELDEVVVYDGVYFTHEYQVNSKEKIYYAPKVWRTETETFINEKYGYYTVSVTMFLEVKLEKVSNEKLELIFGG